MLRRGPGADSRSSYLALVAQHSKERLEDELGNVLESMYSLYAKVAVLTVLFKLTNGEEAPGSLQALSEVMTGEPEVLPETCESLVEICRGVAFKVYPFYAAAVYKQLVALSSAPHRYNSLASSCLPFLRLCLLHSRTQDGILSSVERQIKDHAKPVISAVKPEQAQLWYAKWVTAFLLTMKEEAPKTLLLRFFKVWSDALFTPALSIKEQVFHVLSAFLTDALARADKDALREMLQIVPSNRIFHLTVKRHQAEQDCSPRLSPFLRAATELCANLKAAKDVCQPQQLQPRKYLRFHGDHAVLTVSSAAAKSRARQDKNTLYLAPPWTATFMVRRTAAGRPPKRSRSIKGRALVSSDKLSAVRLLLETEAEAGGCVGVQAGERQVSLGFVAPVDEWVRLTFVCTSIVPARVPTVFERGKGRKEEVREEAKQDRVHLQAFVGGKLRGSAMLSFAQANLCPTDIGCSSKAFHGDLRSVCIWRDALPIETVLSIKRWDATASARRGLPAFTSVVVCWAFDSASDTGRVLTDVSGNMVRGVLKGRVKWCSSSSKNPSIHPEEVAPWPFDTDNTPEDTAGFLAASSAGRKAIGRSVPAEDENLSSLREGCRHCGVLTFEPDRSRERNLLSRLLEAKSRQKRIQPIELTLRLLGDDVGGDEGENEELLVVQGELKWQGAVNCVCEVVGEYDTGDSALTLRVCRVVRGPPALARAVAGLQFEGEMCDGEIIGEWTAPAKLFLLPELKPLQMRCDVLTVPPQVTLKNGARTLLVNNAKVKAAEAFAVVVLRVGGKGDEVAPLSAEEEDKEPEVSQKQQKEEQKNWACPVCTYLNSPDFSSCSMCTTPNPNPPKADTSESSDSSKKETWTGLGCLDLANAHAGATQCLWEFVVNSKVRPEQHYACVVAHLHVQ